MNKAQVKISTNDKTDNLDHLLERRRLEFDDGKHITTIEQAYDFLREYYGEQWNLIAKYHRIDKYAHSYDSKFRIHFGVGKSTYIFQNIFLHLSFYHWPAIDSHGYNVAHSHNFPSVSYVSQVLDIEPKMPTWKFRASLYKKKIRSKIYMYNRRIHRLLTNRKLTPFLYYNTAEDVKKAIDDYISKRWPTMYNESADWEIGPSWEAEIKWQRDFGELRFKVYQPIEHDNAIPLSKRHIDFKFHRIDNAGETSYTDIMMSPTKKCLKKLLKSFDEQTIYNLRKADENNEQRTI